MHSLLKIDTFIAQEIKTNNLDLTMITETWINVTQEDKAWLHQSELIKSGYAISTYNRPSRGGGIALPYKDHMEVNKIEAQHLHTIKYAIWQQVSKTKLSQSFV